MGEFFKLINIGFEKQGPEVQNSDKLTFEVPIFVKKWHNFFFQKMRARATGSNFFR